MMVLLSLCVRTNSQGERAEKRVFTHAQSPLCGASHVVVWLTGPFVPEGNSVLHSPGVEELLAAAPPTGRPVNCQVIKTS